MPNAASRLDKRECDSEINVTCYRRGKPLSTPETRKTCDDSRRVQCLYDVDGIRSIRTNPPSIQKILLKRNRNHKNDNHGFHCQFSLTILLCLRSDTRHYGYSNRCFYLLTYYSGTILVFFLTEFRYDSLFSE